MPAVSTQRHRPVARVLALLCSTALAGTLLPMAAPMTPAKAQSLYGATGGLARDGGGKGGDAGEDGVDATGANAGSGGSAGTAADRDGDKGGSGDAGGGGGGGYSNIVSGDISADMTGGNGGDGGDGSIHGGGGGAGDGARNTDAAPDIHVSATVQGGNGGNTVYPGGSGGGGGAGLVLQHAGTVTIESGATAAGGSGGNPSLFGGGGGAGVVLNEGGTLVNHGQIQGGVGGDLSTNGTAVVMGGSANVANDGHITGGTGGNFNPAGAGIDLRNGGSLINSGQIAGGDGGASQAEGFNNPNGGTGSGGAPGFIVDVLTTGNGAAGVIGANVSVINAGTIAGGMGIFGRIDGRVNAITFTGGVNRLELRKGSTVEGNVVVESGATGTLALGGDSDPDASFNVSKIVTTATDGATDEYAGFSTFEKTGASTWTLDGTGAQDWLINNGTLVGDTNSFGGDLTFGSGAGARGVVFNQTIDGTYSGTVSGDGNLTKAGAGTLTLTGDNQFDHFTVRDGTLAVDGGTLDQPDYVPGSSNYIGEAAGDDASLVITNGGKVYAANWFSIGHFANARGSVLVSGNGSNLDADFMITVGDYGEGVLSVLGGGHASAGFLYVGGGDGPGTGALSVNGGGSAVDAGTLYIGYHDGSTGAVTLSDGGTLDAQYNIWMGTENTTGSADLNIGAASTNPADAVAPGTLHAPEMDFYHDSASLNFNHTGDAYVFDTPLVSMDAGDGFVHHYAGVTSLTGDSSGFSGDTIVHGGTLAVNGTLGGAAMVESGGTLVVGDDDHATATFAGDVNVDAGGTLGGSGTIGGDVDIDGVLSAGNSPGTLTIDGDLALNSGSTSIFELNTPGVVGGTGAGGNDLVEVGGNLSLGGALDARVAAAGYYRLIDYDGTLTGTFDSGTLTGTGGFTPLFPNSPDIRYDTPYQVNLSVLAAGQAMLFWDGSNISANGAVDGGTGAWSDSATNWTDETGGANGGWGGSVGVFAGSAGTVMVDGTQNFDTLQFSTDGYLLTGGALALSPASGTAGTFNVDNGVSAVVASTIADGTGSSLKKAGGGTLVLTGANSYTGGTQLLGGVLSVSADANLGAASGGLSFDGGTLATTGDMQSARDVTLNVTGSFDVAADSELGLTGEVSGAGDLLKSGSGTLRLSGTNSYGNTLVQDGTLIGDADSISGHIGNDATVVFDQNIDGTFAGNIGPLTTPGGVMVKQGAGKLTLSGPSGLDWSIKAGGLSTAAERFDGNADIATGASLTFEQVASAFYGGVLSGTGQFIKTGTGTLAYDGDSSAFAGDTTIADGGLIVGSDSTHAAAALGGSFDVENGGILGGHGMLGSGAGSTVTIASGGTIAPGNSIGTLTIDGDYAQLAGSTYIAEIEPGGTSDLIDVKGKATIEGGTVFALKAPGGYGPGTRYTILTADGGVTGMYGTLDQNAPFVDLALAYDPDNVYLDVARNDVAFCDIAGTFNQCSTGDGAESLGAGDPVYDAIAGLPDAGTARHALDQLSGEIHASARTALIEDSHFVRDAVNDRIRSAFGDITGTEMPVLAYGEGGARPAAADSVGPVAWGYAFGSWGSFEGDGNAAGMDTSTGGFLTGIDTDVAPNIRLGLLAGYSHSSFDVDDRASSGQSDNYHLGLYAGGKWDAFRLTGGLAYTWHDIETNRSVAFPGFSDSLTGDYHAGTFQVFGEAAYRIDTGTIAIEPFANLAYVNLHTGGFTEEGGAAALRVDGETTEATFTTLGVHLSSTFDLGGMKATTHGTLGWRHAFGDTTPISTHAFAGGDPFDIAGVPIAKDAALIEAGLDLNLAPNATLGVAYQGQIANDARQHGFNAKLEVRF